MPEAVFLHRLIGINHVPLLIGKGNQGVLYMVALFYQFLQEPVADGNREITDFYLDYAVYATVAVDRIDKQKRRRLVLHNHMILRCGYPIAVLGKRFNPKEVVA